GSRQDAECWICWSPDPESNSKLKAGLLTLASLPQLADGHSPSTAAGLVPLLRYPDPILPLLCENEIQRGVLRWTSHSALCPSEAWSTLSGGSPKVLPPCLPSVPLNCSLKHKQTVLFSPPGLFATFISDKWKKPHMPPTPGMSEVETVPPSLEECSPGTLTLLQPAKLLRLKKSQDGDDLPAGFIRNFHLPKPRSPVKQLPNRVISTVVSPDSRSRAREGARGGLLALQRLLCISPENLSPDLGRGSRELGVGTV
ncbi:hypothetical protein JOQ06_001585, partial [Pogonophryne albipinna]